MRYLLPLLLSSALAAQSTTSYGQGCGSFLSLDLPRIGQPVNAIVQNDDAAFGIIGVGLAKANIPIGEICTLLITPLFTTNFKSSMGNGSVTLFTLPEDPALIGKHFYVQAVSADSRGASWSQGVDAVIGP